MKCRSLALIAGAVAVTNATAQNEFIPLTTILGGDGTTIPTALSDDGTTVVGRAFTLLGDERSFRWIEGQGSFVLNPFAGGSPETARVFDVNADGTIAVGVTQWFNPAFNNEGAAWTFGSATPTTQGRLYGNGISNATCTTADGTRFFGSASTPFSQPPAVFTPGGVPAIRILPGFTDTDSGFVQACSADGQFASGSLNLISARRAFRWASTGPSSGSFILLDILPGGQPNQSAEDISDDGSVIVGYSASAAALSVEAAMWDANGNATALGFLPGGAFSQANACSADGSIVVGSSQLGGGSGAFIWSQQTGMLELRQVLLDAGVPEADTWFVRNAVDLSADGSRVLIEAFESGVFLTQAVVVDLPNMSCISRADLNRDGFIDVSDLIAFLQAFGASGGAADVLAPAGAPDVFDLIAFLQDFSAGC